MTTLMHEDDEMESFENEEDDEAFAAEDLEADDESIPAALLRRKLPVGRFSPVKGIRGGSAHTPNGAVQIRLPTHVVTRKEFMRFRAEVALASRRTAAAIAAQARRAARQNKQSRQYQQLAAVASLLVPPRELSSITLSGGAPQTVTSTVYKPNLMATLAPLAPVLLQETGILGGKDEGAAAKPSGGNGPDMNTLLLFGAIAYALSRQPQTAGS